ncbi:MAG: 30S ribosomal protein S8 [Blastochloris sp.]|nr:30S ribosomal protein S8 [Blastochloris sp.]
MMQTDPLADFLTIIRNANKVSKAEIIAPYSRLKGDVADVLKKEGFIEDFELTKEGKLPKLKVTLKSNQRQKAIRGIRRVSKPGIRIYVGAREIPKVLGGLGVSILSTPKGVMSGREAKKQNVGGEVLLYIW